MKIHGWLFAASLCAVYVAWGGTAARAGDDEDVALSVKAGESKTTWRAQSLGAMDIPVGETIELRGCTIKTKAGERGELEVDLGEKFPKKLRTKGQVTVTLQDPEDEKKKLTLKLEFQKGEGDKWTYRNSTVLTLKLKKAKTELTVVDANGNGIYNEAHVDGMAWPEEDVLFPLPAAADRWATEDMDLTGLAFGPWGEEPKAQGKTLASISPGALPVLIDVNRERIKRGLTPRPEDPNLTRPLQSHSQYMLTNNQLTHPEDANKPGYTKEGNDAGMRSILGMRQVPDDMAQGMVQTLYHRFDVIRANTLGFGVGWASGGRTGYGGIDGRTTLMGNAPAHWWPVLCPMPGEEDVPLTFRLESPDPIKGDTSAGFAVSAVFSGSNLKLEEHRLSVVDSKGKLGPAIDCYTFDSSDGMMKFLHAAAIMAKDPLQPDTEYEAMLKVSVDGQSWTKTWRFHTMKGAHGMPRRQRTPPRR